MENADSHHMKKITGLTTLAALAKLDLTDDTIYNVIHHHDPELNMEPVIYPVKAKRLFDWLCERTGKELLEEIGFSDSEGPIRWDGPVFWLDQRWLCATPPLDGADDSN